MLSLSSFLHFPRRCIQSLFTALFIALFFVVFSHGAHAATFTSSQTGNWNLGTTWGGVCASSCVAGTHFPGASDTAIVTSTHTVTLPTAVTANFTTITVGGTATLKLIGQLSGGDLTINSGATVQQETASVQTLTGTLTVNTGGTLTHTANTTALAYTLNFTVGTAVINGTVTATGKGYRGGQSGATTGAGTGGAIGTLGGAGGGAYGGGGGTGSSAASPAVTTYGSIVAPADLGSGGGYSGGAGLNGGAGGGLVTITATNLTLAGSIVANGAPGLASSFYNGGAGSGGGVYLNVASTFNGAGGTLTANGGAGTASGGHFAGGGGGGRISVSGYTSYTAATTFTAYGGTAGGGAATHGGAGTLFVKSNSNGGTLTLDNNNQTSGTMSPIPSGQDLSIDEIVLKKGAGLSIPAGVSVTTTQSTFNGTSGTATPLSIAGTFNPQSSSFTFPALITLTIASTANLKTVTDLTINSVTAGITRGFTNLITALTVGSGSTLTLSSYTALNGWSLTSLTVNGTLTHAANTTSIANIVNITATTVTVAGSINVTGKGYQGGQSGATTGAGTGGAGGVTGGAGGGAYGGGGGAGSAGAGSATTYGSSTVPADFGSGGGYSGSVGINGGAGGGLVTITATNLTLAGSIVANGAPGLASSFYNGGAGAGGGVYLNIAGTFNGAGGTLTANGGAGTASGGHFAGGGGGGRISVSGYTSYTAATTFTAYGGTAGGGAATHGGAGTLFVKSSSNAGTLTLDNNNQTSGTMSPIPSGQNLSIDEIVIKRGAGLSIPSGVSVTTTQSTFTGAGGTASIITIAGTFDPQSASFTFPASTTLTIASTANLKSMTSLTINSVTAGITRGFTNLITALTVGSGSTLTLSSYTALNGWSLTSLTVNGTLTHAANTTSIANIVNITATTVTVAGSINVTGKGYQGGQSGATTGAGTGGAVSGTGAGGGAHGGAGGNGNTGAGSVTTYGSSTVPADFGSGGGYSGSVGINGGAGGGLVTITATNFTLTGSIVANGASGLTSSFYNGGSGSGGSIYLNVSGTFTGSGGTLTANGGAGTTSGGYGSGGGGGGRIAIGGREGSIASFPTVTVDGGTKALVAAQVGSAGTKVVLPDTGFSLASSYTNLTLPASVSGTSTYQISAVTAVDVTIRRSTDSYYWNGSGWAVPLAWLRATGSASWSYSLAGIDFTDGATYTVTSRATDSMSLTEWVLPTTPFLYTQDLSPPAPTSLILSNVSSSTATVSWTDNSSGLSSETSFIVYTSTDGIAYSSAIAVDANVTTANVTSLIANTATYYFKVKALSADGENTSSVVSTSTRIATPSSFTNGGLVTSSTVPLSWSAEGNAGTTVYEILNQTTSTWLIATTTATSYTVSSLTPNASYTFGLRGIEVTTGGYTSTLTYTTATLPLVPSAPTGLIPSMITTSTLTLDWTDNASGQSQETSVEVQRSTDGSAYSTIATLGADSTFYTFTGLTPNQTYYFKVSATNAAGSGLSTAVSTSTLVMTPSAFTAGTPTINSLPFTWSSNGNAADTVYEILNVTTSSWSIATTTDTSYTVTGLAHGTAYTIAVRAIQTGSVPTSYSAQQEAAATTNPGAPSAPTGVTISEVGTTSVRLSWTDTAGGGDQETSMVVSGSEDDVSYSTLATLAADTVTTEIAGLTANALRYFKVAAANGEGSGVSSAVSTTTHVTAPTSFTAGAAATTSTMPLSWNTGSNALDTEYELRNITTSTWIVATLPGGSYTVTGLLPNITYSFSLRAIQKNADPAAYSSVATYSATTSLDTPAAPSALQVLLVSETSVGLSWTDHASGDSEETSMVVSRSTDGVTYSTAATLAANTLTTTLTGLTPNTTYFFKVAATNGAGAGSSDAVSTSTLVRAPTGLGLDGATTLSTIPLRWSANGNGPATVYEILNQTTSTWLVATTTDASYTVTDLVYDSEYTFGVRALQTASDPVTYSGAVTYSATTYIEAPTAPTALSLADVTSSTLTLTWTDTASGDHQETEQVITRSTDGVTYETVSTVAADVTTHAATGLTPNSTVFFKVTASNRSGSSASMAVSTSTLVVTPTLFTVGSVTTSTAALSWGSGGNALGTVYELINQTTSTWVIATTTARSYSVTGLSSLTTYSFGLRAIQQGSDPESYSDTLTAAVSTPLDAPVAPSDLVVSDVSSSGVSLSWTDNSHPGDQEANFLVLRSTDGVSYSTTLTLESDVTSTTVTGLTPNLTYYFKISAVNESASAVSGVVSTSTHVLTPISFATSTPTAYTVPLSWNAHGNAPGTVFVVTNETTSTWVIATTTATSYTVRGLVPNQAYSFGLRAIQAGSDPAEYSEQVLVSAMTDRDVPTAPTALHLSDVTDASVMLGWTDTASGSTQEDQVVVSRSTDDVVYSTVATLDADTVTRAITGLIPNTTYYFKVTAVNSAGSGVSASLATTTHVVTPTAFATSTAPTTSTIALSWGSNGNAAGTVYQLLNNTTSTWVMAEVTAGSYVVTDLAPLTTYVFGLRAVQRESDPTSYSSVVTLSEATRPTAPAAATGLDLFDVSTSTVSLSWTDNASGSSQESSIELLHSTDNIAYSTDASYPADTTSTQITGLSEGVRYFFKLRVSNISGVATSIAVSTTTIDRTPTATPSSFMSIVSGSSVVHTWTNPVAPDFASVIVRRGTTSYPSTITDGSSVYSGVGTTIAESDLADGTYNYSLFAIDAADNISVAATSTAIVDTVSPTLSTISAVASTTTALISWASDSLTTSKVVYSVNESFASSTIESNTGSDRTTAHTVSLTGLVPCVLYSYKVVSRDVSLNAATSTARTFTTLGCVGGADILESTSEAIPIVTGGTVTLGAGDTRVILTVPVGYADQDSVFQLKQLDRAPVMTVLDEPNEHLSLEGQHIFDFRAFMEDQSALRLFAAPLQVTMSYAAEDLATLDPSSLRLFRNDEGEWTELDHCVVDADARTVTCSTSHFSIFGLFGRAPGVTPAPVSPTVVAESRGAGALVSYGVTAKGLNGAPLTFEVNGGALQTDNVVVQLALNGDPSTVRGYALSLDPTFPQASLLPYERTVAYQLPQRPGTYTLYLQYFSTTGDRSSVIARTIELVAPRVTSNPVVTQKGTTVTKRRFTKNLVQGTVNEDVKRLQQFLNGKGYVVAKSGPGSPKNETTRFGASTKQALIRFQKANKIVPANGSFLDKTRAAVNALFP